MRRLYIILFILIPFIAYGQENRQVKKYVDGSVVDSQTKHGIYSASVSLLTVSDSIFIKGLLTDSVGRFSISVPEKRKYILKVSMIGYSTSYIDIETPLKDNHLDLGNILLEDKSILLSEAVVIANIPPIVVKGDTIEYNSNSYMADEHAMLKDLINNIPGLEADDNGNILANGKPITKIMVDGKEFFGNDISLALSSLPADMIKKLQVFKNESDLSKITGFKDKKPEQVLNLVVKEELKRTILGEAVGGLGSDNRYVADVQGRYLSDDEQLVFIAQSSNITDSPLSLGNKDDKTKNLATNFYISPMDKMNFGLYVKYLGDDNVSETYDNTQYYLQNGDRISKQNILNRASADRISTGMNFSWKVDSMTMIYARISYAISDQKNINRSNGLSFVENVNDSTITNYNNQSNSNEYTLNNSITIGRRLNSKGRSVSLVLDYTMRNNKSKGNNLSSTLYTDLSPSINLDQKLQSDDNTQSYGFSLDYVEPIAKDKSIKLSYSMNKNNSESNKTTWRKDDLEEYSILDKDYTRQTKNDNTNQLFSIEFMSVKEKYNYIIGFSVDPSSSHSQILGVDSIIDNLEQHLVNYSSSFNLYYEPTSNSSLNINYYGKTDQPGIRQLSADTTVINATNKTFGNPGLKPSYNNRIDLSYQKSDYGTGSFLVIALGADYTFNSIVNYTVIDRQGNSENTFRNVDGNWGTSASFLINSPLRNKRFTVNSATSINYDRRIGFSNASKSKTYNYIISQNASVKYKINKFENLLRTGIIFNIAENNLSQVENQKTTTFKLQDKFTWRLPYDIIMQSDIVYSYFYGFGSDFKRNEVLWNASISKNFLKNKNANLKLEMFDILNDRNNIKRVVTSNFSSDSRTNTISRYFLLTFSYKLNIFKGDQNNMNG